MIHILVWAVLGLAIFYYQPFFSDLDIPYQFWIRQTVKLSLLVIAFYVNSLVLVPNLLLKNRTGYYFVIIVGIIALIVFINGWLERALHLDELFQAAFHKQSQGQSAEILMPQHLPKPGSRVGVSDALLVTISALVLGISTSMATIHKWLKDKQKSEELEKDKITTELSFLKAQINPHFFFNTMNNIYALTAVDAELAGKAIHQLSRMMRYLLYNTQSGYTMLSQEIAFVKDYISLMQLRLTDAVVMNIDTPPNLVDVPVAPMIFLPFVENAFKHGVRAAQPSHVNISILQKDKTLDLTIKNSIIKDNSVSLDINNGIGLVNTKRRLDLLYPGKYKLDINELNADNEYTVHLVLDLS
jgi:sensor histidine kinase YesM